MFFVCFLFLFFSLPQLYNDEDQSKHYTLSVLRTLHYCDMVLRVLSHYRSVIACARAHARAHKAYLYIDGSVCISSLYIDGSVCISSLYIDGSVCISSLYIDGSVCISSLYIDGSVCISSLYIDGSVCISSFWMLYDRAHFVS